MTEEGNFQRKILKWLECVNIYAIKYNASGISKTGIPDILCNLNGTFLAIEVKKENGKPTELQKYNIRRINKDGGIAILLRPSQFKTFKDIISLYAVMGIDIKKLKRDMLVEFNIE